MICENLMYTPNVIVRQPVRMKSYGLDLGSSPTNLCMQKLKKRRKTEIGFVTTRS